MENFIEINGFNILFDSNIVYSRDTVTPKNNPKFFERLLGNPTKSLQNLVWKFQNVPTIQERRYITTPFNMIGYC